MVIEVILKEIEEMIGLSKATLYRNLQQKNK